MKVIPASSVWRIELRLPDYLRALNLIWVTEMSAEVEPCLRDVCAYLHHLQPLLSSMPKCDHMAPTIGERRSWMMDGWSLRPGPPQTAHTKILGAISRLPLEVSSDKII